MHSHVLRSYDVSLNITNSNEIRINVEMLKYLTDSISLMVTPKEFTHPGMERFNTKTQASGNIYGLDANYIPIRRNDRNAKSPFAWREINGEKYNINTPPYLLPGSYEAIPDNLFEQIIEAIHKQFPKTRNKKCAFNKITEFVIEEILKK